MRKTLPQKLRTEILLANKHSCCICGKGNVQIHHIDSDATNNEWSNLVVLCLEHHDKVTVPKGLSASITPQQIVKYKESWERSCKEQNHKIARSKASFFMVDYKNAERIRQLYSQLSKAELEKAYHLVREEFVEEEQLRKEQGFSISIEPNTSWNSNVERLVEEIKSGNPHPEIFSKSEVHPLDHFYPIGPVFANPAKFYYDIWCQIMVRCLLVNRHVYNLNDLLEVENPQDLIISGQLMVYEGSLKGKIVPPNQFKEIQLSHTVLRIANENISWLTNLSIKTHYVYSVTAAEALSNGRSNGVLMIRSIDNVKTTQKCRIVKFSSTPLIMGSGGGKTLKI